jgi:hypothetical protein
MRCWPTCQGEQSPPGSGRPPDRSVESRVRLLGAYCEVRAFSEVYVLSGRCAASRPGSAVYRTGRHRGFVTHPGRVPSPRRMAFIFPSRNCASATPSARS